MKAWWLAPWLVLQGLVGPPPDRPINCLDLPPDQRAACEAEQMAPPPPIPSYRGYQVPDDRRVPTGYEFSSPQTFSGEEEGSPSF